MYNRYYKAAMKVVKKRRANHVQHWRMRNTHKPLIYSAPDLDFQPQATVQDNEEEDRYYEEEGPYEEERRLAGSRAEEDRNGEEERVGEPRAEEERVGEPRAEEERNGEEDRVGGPRVAEEEDVDEDDNEFECPSCDTKFPLTKAFPQTTTAFWSTGGGPKRCEPCWKQHMITNVVPHIHCTTKREKLVSLINGEKLTRKRKQSGSQAATKKKERPGTLVSGVEAPHTRPVDPVNVLTTPATLLPAPPTHNRQFLLFLPPTHNRRFLLLLPPTHNRRFLLLLPPTHNRQFLLLLPPTCNRQFLLLLPPTCNRQFLLLLPPTHNRRFLLLLLSLTTLATMFWACGLEASGSWPMLLRRMTDSMICTSPTVAVSN
jgi:hypothetical protein